MPDVDAIIVPVGGGGLIAGVAAAAKAMKPDVEIIGVQAKNAPAFTVSMRRGESTFHPVGSTLADGLAVSLPGVNAVETAKDIVDRMILISEDYIASAILRLLEWEKMVAEGAGSIGVAAILSGKLQDFRGKKVVVIISGGNIDTTILGRCIDRGLAVDGRLCKFCVTVTDRPGSVAMLTQMMTDIGVSIKDIIHERAWLKSDIFGVQLTCVAETRDAQHAQQLEQILYKNYSKVWFPRVWHDLTIDEDDAKGDYKNSL